MRADDVLQLRAVERAEKARRMLVIEMAERPGDALLQPARVGAVPEHVAVVVAFEHQRPAPREHLLDVARAAADAGQHAYARPATATPVLPRFGGVVRYRQRAHLERPVGEL